jgi:polyisoprenoid-binding protein YceI
MFNKNEVTMKIRLLTTIFLLSVSIVWAQSDWTIDKSHTNIKFNATHLVISEVSGEFKEYDAMVESKSPDFNGADIEFTALVASINTGNDQRDNHLKSDDFFNAEKYPELKFKGKLVREGEKYLLKGALTMRDVTKPVTFEVVYNGTITDPWGNTKAGFKIKGMVNRLDYGLKWNTMMEAGGAVVGEEIEIECNVELQKKA